MTRARSRRWSDVPIHGERRVSREGKWFDRPVPNDVFPLLVRQELAVLLDRGFRVVREHAHLVRLESQNVAIEAKLDPASPRAYKKAQFALTVKEDMTFSEEEIDRFLPAALHSLRNEQAQS